MDPLDEARINAEIGDMVTFVFKELSEY